MTEEEYITSELAVARQDLKDAPETVKELLSNLIDYQDLMLLYDAAIKIVRTKLEIIRTAYQAKYRRNPIQNISSRRKKTASIANKLQRIGAPFDVDNIEAHLHDIAGVRVTCSYLDDVYELAQAISEHEDVRVSKQKDYITNPKHNGYRSLHLILSVPVSVPNGMRWVEVEVQLRTVAMDFWASLEHQLKYKHDIVEGGQIVDRLRICAETIANLDVEMLSIRRKIETHAEEPSEMQTMMERFEK